jgi:hypothetical protein
MKIWEVIDELESGRELISLLGETEQNHEKSVRIAGLRAKIWTLDLPSTKQEC